MREEVLERLRQGLSGDRLGHAYLVIGEGGELAESAKMFASLLLCEHRKGCGECSPCLAIARERHPDVRVVEPEGLSMKIAPIRVVRTDSLVSGMWSRTVVYLFVLADRMTPAAANAFLKILEEPFPGVVFGLFTARPGNLPATIISRCQMIKLPREGLAGVEDEEVRQRACEFGALLAEAACDRYDQALPHLDRWRSKREQALGMLEALGIMLREHWHAGRCPLELLEAMEETKTHLDRNVDVMLALENLYVRAAAVPLVQRGWGGGSGPEAS